MAANSHHGCVNIHQLWIKEIARYCICFRGDSRLVNLGNLLLKVAREQKQIPELFPQRLEGPRMGTNPDFNRKQRGRL